MQTIAILTMLGFAIGAIALSWLYFRRYRVNRPPIGVINLYDIGLMIAGIVVVPYLYLWIPPWLVVGLLALGALSLLSLGLEPVVRKSWVSWVITLVLIGADIAAAYLWTTHSPAFLLINNVVMLLIVVSISNLWAQSGLKARDVTLLAAALILYDLVATSYLPVMGDLFQRMMALPMGTQFAWRAGEAGLAAIGIGDVLLAEITELGIDVRNGILDLLQQGRNFLFPSFFRAGGLHLRDGDGGEGWWEFPVVFIHDRGRPPVDQEQQAIKGKVPRGE